MLTKIHNVLIIIFTLAAIYLLFHNKYIITYKDDIITAGYYYKYIDYVIRHNLFRSYLTINNKMYKHTLGSPPYILTIPDSDLLIFVTYKNNTENNLYIYNTNNHDYVIIGGTHGFGGMIGSVRKPGDTSTEYVEHYSTNRLTLCRKMKERSEKYYINLVDHRCEKVETHYFDTNGNTTNITTTENMK